MNIDFNLKIFSFTWRISIARRHLQSILIAAVVLIAMVSAYWGSMPVLIALIVLIVGIAGLNHLLRLPNMIYILILLGGMFIPFSGPGGINASVLFLLLLAGIWVMDMLVVKRRFRIVYSRPIRPIIYFLVVCIVALGIGQISWFVFAGQAPLDAQLGGFAIYFFLPLLVIMTPSLIKDEFWLKIVFWAFIGLSMLYVAGRGFYLPFADQIYQYGYIANSMLWTWLAALLASQIIYNHELKWHWRIILIVCFALVIFVALVQQNEWKSGWVPPAVAVLALIGFRFKRLAILAMPFALFVGLFLTRDLISTDQYSWGTRVDAWLIVLEISRTSPLIGLGFANYYWYTPLIPIRGYYTTFNSHSQFVDLIAQTGVLGLLGFLWILFEVGLLAWNLSTRVKDGFARGYSYGVLAGVLGSVMAAFLVDWVLPFTYNIGLDGVRASILPWIFFGGLISVEQIYVKNNK